jgi:hypothetical protein
MNANKRKRLEAKGWQVGNATEFLKLSPEEAAIVEIRLALSSQLKRRRAAGEMTQSQLVRRYGK